MEPQLRSAPAGEGPLRRHAAWLLVVLAYLYVFPYYERLNNPNENARVWMTRAIVEHHVLNIDEMQRQWGYVNDKATSGVHVYSGKAPGASFLGVPVLFAQTGLRRLFGLPPPSKLQTTLALRIFAIELPLALFLFFFARYVERVSGSPVARDLLVVGLGVGTLIYPYGVIFVGHALAAAAAFSGFMLLSWPARAAGRGQGASAPDRLFPPVPERLFAAGVLVGCAVIFEYQAVLVAAAIAVYAAVRHRRRALAFFAGAMPPTLALGAYHTVLFGRPWRFPFGNVENPVYAREAHSAGFHGLSLPKLGAIGSSLFAPDYGLFVFSPVLALGAVCGVIALRRGPRREALLSLAVAVVMLLFLGGMSNWRAGWCAGPRYIASVAPFLIIPIALLWPRVRARFALSLATAALVIPSVLLNAVSAAVYPHYPTELRNPVFDLAFPTLGAGYVPYSLGWWLHLPGLWSLAPLGAALLLAISLGAGGEDRRPARWAAHAALAALLAAAFLLPLSRYGRNRNAAEERAVTVVRSLWEPPPRLPGR
jgi:hypothetical protein